MWGGIGFAVLNVTSAAGAANVLPPSRMGEGLGYFGVEQSLSMALGPMSGLALAAYGKGSPVAFFPDTEVVCGYIAAPKPTL